MSAPYLLAPLKKVMLYNMVYNTLVKDFMSVLWHFDILLCNLHSDFLNTAESSQRDFSLKNPHSIKKSSLQLTPEIFSKLRSVEWDGRVKTDGFCSVPQ